MSDDLEVTLEPDDEDTIHQAFFDKLPVDEQRRYVCLDMARLSGCLPDKMVDLAKKMDSFLRGTSLRPVND